MSSAHEARRRWLALVVLCVGQLMIVLDGSATNVALPSIQADLHYSQASLSWVVNAYFLTFGGLLLLAGRAGDLLGRRKVFLGGLTLFTAASMACGLATSPVVLTTARAVQGAGAAATSAMILGIVTTTFDDVANRTRAMSIYAFVSVAGGSLGLVVGGGLTQLLNWHWIFFVNLPIGLAALVLSVILIRPHTGLGVAAGVDVTGAVLITAAPMLAVYGIVQASSRGWTSARSVGLLGAALGLLAVFLVVETRARTPLIPLRLFRSSTMVGANLLRCMFAVSMNASFFLSALYLQRVLHYRTFDTGLAYLPQAIPVALFSLLITPRLMSRFGSPRCVVAGLVMMAAGLAFLGRLPVQGSYLPDVFPAMLAIGVGGGLVFLPSVALAMTVAQNRPQDAGVASGLANIAVQLSAALGIAVMASVSSVRSDHLARAGVPLARALTSGYRLGFLACAGAALAGVLAAVVLLRRPAAAARPVETTAVLALEAL